MKAIAEFKDAWLCEWSEAKWTLPLQWKRTRKNGTEQCKKRDSPREGTRCTVQGAPKRAAFRL